jgi:hypothetical protein
MKTTTKRAAKGGEFGANGEFYEGGRFINTVEMNPKRFGSLPKPAKLRKVQINPYAWAMQEKPNQRPIFSLVGAGGIMVNGRMEIYLPPFESPYGGVGFCFGVSLEEMQTFCDRYNAGEIWM